MRHSLSTLFALLFPIFAVSLATAAPSQWQPAIVTSRAALGDTKGFTLKVMVRLPQLKACYDERIRPMALDPHSPTFYVVEQMYKGGMCGDVITMVQVQRHFNAKPLPKGGNCSRARREKETATLDSPNRHRKSVDFVRSESDGPKSI